MTRFLLAWLTAFAVSLPAFAAEAVDAAHGTAEAAAHHGGEGGGSLPQFNLATFPSQSFWLFVTFFTMYFVIKNVIIPQIAGTMQKRDDHIRQELQEAGALNEKAMLLQRDYDTSMQNARTDAQAKIAKATNAVATSFTDAETKQRSTFLNKRNAFVGSYQAHRAEMMSELEAEARTLAADVAAKVLAPSSTSKQKAA